MASKLAQLRELRASLAKQARELNDKYPAGTRMPDDDSAALDALLARVEACDDDIAREVRIAEKVGDEHEAALNDATRNPGRQSQESPALRAYLANGLQALSADQRQVMAARQTPDIRNAMSTTTGGEGGYTVASEYYRQLTEAMKLTGGIRQVATVFQTGSGAQMNFPGTDATSEIGEIVGQNAAVSAGDTTFTNVTMDVYKYSSKKIALPFELVQDSMFDIEAYIQRLLAVRLGRITSQHFTLGTGSGQPRGLVTALSTGVTGATGNTTAVTYDALVDLEHSVDPAYRVERGVGYMMNDASVKVIRKIKDAQNRPIFVPGYEANALVDGGAPDTLMGRPIYINQDMPVMAANAKSIAFGDFSRYLIREVMDLTMFRMADSGFILNGQIGFVAFNRMGGNIIDANAAKLYVNSAT